MNNKTQKPKKPNKPKKQKVFNLFQKNCEYFKDSSDNLYVTFKNDGVSFPLTSKEASERILKLAYKANLLSFSNINGKSLMEFLEDHARATVEATCEIYTRVGGELTGSALTIYIKLNQFKVLKVFGGGYEIISNNLQNLRFISSKSNLDMPEPDFSGDISLLKNFINCKNEDDLKLVICYIIYTFFPAFYGSKPVLVLEGEQGSGKSTISKMLKMLIDPSLHPLATIRTEEDLILTAQSEWLTVLDNISGIKNSISDAICKIATGTSLMKRKLFTDGETYTVFAKKPFIINGIDGLIAREDFADRCILISLAEIISRKSEVELNREFERTIAKIFGAVIVTLSKVLQVLPNISSNSLPRMADFAKLGIAVEKVLGWQEGEFLRIYESNRREIVYYTTENDILSMCIQELVKERKEKSFIINPTPLYNELLKVCEDMYSAHLIHFPKSPIVMGHNLKRLIPHLKKIGINIKRTPRKAMERGYLIISQ